MASRSPFIGDDHNSMELQLFQQLLDQFYDKYARSLSGQKLKDAKAHLTTLITGIRNNLQSKRYTKEINFQGSIYEGIKTILQTIEFDCMAVMEHGNHLEIVSDRPGFAKLRLKSNDNPQLNRIVKNGYLSIASMRADFQSQLTKALNEMNIRQGEVKLQAHGPAVQLNVFKRDGSKWYEVDLLPGFKPNGQDAYIAKSYASNSDMAWRKSYSREERAILDSCDKGNQCHKEVVRMMKVIREIGMKGLESYIIKTTLLHMLKKDSSSWERKDRALRLIDMMRKLQGYLESKRLPHYFVPSMNLLDNYTPAQTQNMACYLKGLLNSKSKMMSLLQISM